MILSFLKKEQDWHFGRRLTWWIVASVALLLVIQFVLVQWYVRDTLDRELDALAVEEIAELKVGLREGPLELGRLQALAEKLDHEHPEAFLGIRVWRSALKEPWIVAGSEKTAPWPPRLDGPEGAAFDMPAILRLSGTALSGSVTLPDGSVVDEEVFLELLIDGTPREEDLKRFVAFYLLIGLLGGFAVVLAGILFSRQISRMLTNVATSAAGTRLDDDSEPAIPTRAPQEIRAVADAFSESIKRMRSEHSRNVLLTAGLAHELRSPLQNLISEAEVGLLKERDGEEYRRLVRFQLEECRALALVVDNLITLTAIRDHQALPRGECFDMADELRIRFGHEREVAGRRNIRIEIEERGDSRICGDREALVLMVRNLLGNAIRWTPDGSKVSMRLESHADRFEMVIEDQGPGVDPGEREQIFEAFYQGRTPFGNRAGYGLGLALARAAARAEGGDIEVGSGEGGGAQFRVVLPIREAS